MTTRFDIDCMRALDQGTPPAKLRAELENAISIHPTLTLRAMADSIGPLDWQHSALGIYATGYAERERWGVYLGRGQDHLCIVTLGKAGGRNWTKYAENYVDRAEIIAWLTRPRKQGRLAAAELLQRLAGP